MNKELIQYKNPAAIISTIFLLLAIARLPYGYYIFLRWVVTVSAIFLLWISYKSEKTLLVVLMAIIALLFNPIAPVHLDKSTWVIIDFVAAILFLVSAFKLKPEKQYFIKRPRYK